MNPESLTGDVGLRRIKKCSFSLSQSKQWNDRLGTWYRSIIFLELSPTKYSCSDWLTPFSLTNLIGWLFSDVVLFDPIKGYLRYYNRQSHCIAQSYYIVTSIKKLQSLMIARPLHLAFYAITRQLCNFQTPKKIQYLSDIISKHHANFQSQRFSSCRAKRGHTDRHSEV